MANTSSRKTTTTKKTTGTAGKTAGKNTGRTSGKGAQPPVPEKRPIRRELWGAGFLVLGLLVTVSYFNVAGAAGIFVDGLADLLKGLFGYGYWLSGPVLFLAALILLFHHGRPVLLRVNCLLLVPFFFGSLTHMVLAPVSYTSSIKIIPTLWKSGLALESGGVASGMLAVGSVAVLSKIASIIIFTAIFVVLVSRAGA